MQTADRLFLYGGGARATLPVTSRVSFVATAAADFVRHHVEDDFDQALFAGSGGFAGPWRRGSWRGGVSRAYQRLGGLAYRHVTGAFADVSLTAGPNDAASLGLQGGRIAYAGPNSVRDSDFAVAILGWRHGLAGAWRAQLEAAVNGGRERNVRGRHDLSRDVAGARIGVAASPLLDWTFAAGVLFQRSRYFEPDAVLATTRRDDYVAGGLALAWSVTPSLTLRAAGRSATRRSVSWASRWSATMPGPGPAPATERAATSRTTT